MAQLIRNITELTRCGTQYRTEMLAPLGLKACHASYLLEICREPGISQDRLAERICINKSNVARQAAALEEAGFISRTPCANDKRIMRLYPTDKTQELMPQIRRIMKDWSSYLTQDLTDEEQVHLAVILTKMKDRASRWMEDHEK